MHIQQFMHFLGRGQVLGGTQAGVREIFGVKKSLPPPPFSNQKYRLPMALKIYLERHALGPFPFQAPK